MVSGLTENKATITKIIDEMAENAKFIEEEKEHEIFAGSEKYKKSDIYYLLNNYFEVDFDTISVNIELIEEYSFDGCNQLSSIQFETGSNKQEMKIEKNKIQQQYLWF